MKAHACNEILLRSLKMSIDFILSLEQTNTRFWTREENFLVVDLDMKIKIRTNKFNHQDTDKTTSRDIYYFLDECDGSKKISLLLSQMSDQFCVKNRVILVNLCNVVQIMLYLFLM